MGAIHRKLFNYFACYLGIQHSCTAYFTHRQTRAASISFSFGDMGNDRLCLANLTALKREFKGNESSQRAHQINFPVRSCFPCKVVWTKCYQNCDTSFVNAEGWSGSCFAISPSKNSQNDKNFKTQVPWQILKRSQKKNSSLLASKFNEAIVGHYTPLP